MRNIRSSRAARRAIAVVAVVAVALAAGVTLLMNADSLEQEALVARFAVRHEPAPQGIVVVGIGSGSLTDLGPWPFPRSDHARVIDNLHKAGAKTIVYDVQFTEPTKPKEDLALYDAIGRAGGAILATTEVGDHGDTNVLGGDDNLKQVHARAAAANLDDGERGVISRFPAAVAGLPTLAVATAERVTGRPVDTSAFAGGNALIDYRGGPHSFPTLSFRSVYHNDFDPSLVRGKIVVIGATAPTQQDVHPTPTSGSKLMSGPEVQANAIWTALHGFPLRQVPGWVDVLFVVLLALAPALLSLRLGGAAVALTAVALAGLWLVAAQLAFNAGHVVAEVAPVSSLGVATAGGLLAIHLAERRDRRRLERESAVLEGVVRERTAELREAQFEIVRRLAQAAESRDEETGQHIERISRMCGMLARAVGLSDAEAELIGEAAALHDLGKIAIPDAILLKPGKLDATEWDIMRRHPELGARMLAGSGSSLIRRAETIALTHHERWDGGGYPARLAGTDIPLEGRICAVCDVFDALLSSRCYKPPWTLEEVVAELEHQRGKHFDPELVDAFLALVPELYADLYEDAETPFTAIVTELPPPAELRSTAQQAS
jgi:HD-GYP domain-containing protein (c-di-GMP phosphodiesterase class II)/CHASE2 domain-containing sensor protein